MKKKPEFFVTPDSVSPYGKLRVPAIILRRSDRRQCVVAHCWSTWFAKLLVTVLNRTRQPKRGEEMTDAEWKAWVEGQFK